MRIKRGAPPARPLTKPNLRIIVLEALRRDFKDRCAYSMQHMDKAGGEVCMHVDHFDPRSKNDEIQQYSNLFLASAHCNIYKGGFFPTREQRAANVRLLNPC